MLTYKTIDYYRLDGQTNVKDRNSFMRNFNTPDHPVNVFILTTRAGGLGINLTSASIVILLDSDWNPQMDLQAMDRAHRIGQTKDVYVYRLITKDTIEEKIIERQVMKLKYDFILLEKGRTQKKKSKDYRFSLNKLCEDEIKDLAYFGVSSILKLERSTADTPGLIDIDSLLHEGEKNAEMLSNILEQKIKEYGEKALEFRSESNYLQFVHDYGEEENSKKLTLQELQKAYYEGERRKREREDREELAKNLDYFERHVPVPQPFQFYQERDVLLYLRKKQERYLFCLRLGLKAPEEYKLTKDEKEKLSFLEQTGFGNWTRKEFEIFVIFSGKYGRLNIEEVSLHMSHKSTDEVYRYACVFWQRLEELASEALPVLNYIEKREYKLYLKHALYFTVNLHLL